MSTTSRNTVAKTRILDLVKNAPMALSHAEIKEQMEGVCDRVTIYRVLDRLVDEGMVHKIIPMDGVVRYAACQECSTEHIHNHIHFSCDACHTVTCLEGVKPQYKLPEKYLVRDANFMLTGLCPECVAAQKE